MNICCQWTWHTAQVELPARLGPKDLKDLPVHRGPPDRLVLRELRDPPGHRELTAHRVPLELPGRKVPPVLQVP